MSKIIRLTESDLARIVRRVINEQTDVTDSERYQLVQQMIKDYINAVYLKPGASDVVESDGKVNRLYATNGVLDQKKVYHFKGDEMAEAMNGYGFPNGFNISETITRPEFETLKKKWNDSLRVIKNDNK